LPSGERSQRRLYKNLISVRPLIGICRRPEQISTPGAEPAGARPAAVPNFTMARLHRRRVLFALGGSVTKRSAQLDATSSPIVRPLSAWCRKCPSLDERGQKVDRRGAGPIETCLKGSYAFLRLGPVGDRPVILRSTLFGTSPAPNWQTIAGEGARSV
jgi:hypothetical protein